MNIYKLLSKIVLAFLVVLTVSVLSLKFYPKIGFWLTEKATDYRISARESHLNIWPLSVNFKDLSVIKPDGRLLLELEKADLNFDLPGAVRGLNNFWSAEIAKGKLDLSQISGTPNQNTKPIQAITPVNIHALLSTIRVEIIDVQLYVNDNIYLQIDQLNTTLNKLDALNPQELIQNITMDLVFNQHQQAIKINGTIRSSFKGGTSLLDISLAELDLSAMLEEPIAKSLSSKKLADMSIRGDAQESLNWGWLYTTQPVRITFKTPQIDLGTNQLKNLIMDVSLDQFININQLEANVMWQLNDWQLNDQYLINDKISLSGSLKPLSKITEGADVAANLELSTNSIRASVFGNANLNGIVDNDLKFALNIGSIPIKLANEGSDDLLKQTEQYLPLHLSLQLKSQESRVDLSKLQLNAGESNVNGAISIVKSVGHKLAIKTRLKSSLISYQSLANSRQSSLATNEQANNSQNNDVFSTEEIDWRWLEAVQIDSLFEVEKLNINKYQFDQLKLPINISDGELRVDGLLSKFSEGSLKSNFSLGKSDNGAELLIDLQLIQASLESSNLIPTEQISGGKVNLDTRLAMSGNNLKQLVASVTGKLLLSIENAKIANSSLNLIGSDLLLKMINKLNPFTATDRYSNLKCAIVHAKFANKKVLFSDSLVLETDKMAIVGDGNLNLQTEKIDFSFNPRAQSGLGINVGTLVKFMKLGGSLSNPKPVVSASGLLKTGVAVGAAMSTGGASLLADGLINKSPRGAACEKAIRAF